MLWYVSMSDILPDKIAETITNIIRKGNVFAKVKKIEKLVYGCAILVVVFGSSIIVNDYLNTRLILKNVTEQEKHSHNIELLHSKVDTLQELNTKLIQLLFKQNGSLVPFVNISQLNSNETICIRSTVSSLTYDLDMDMNENEELEEKDVLINSFENNLII